MENNQVQEDSFFTTPTFSRIPTDILTIRLPQ